MTKKGLIPGALLLIIGSLPLLAQVNIPFTFSSGDKARASEVNANFEALKTAVEILQAKVTTLETELASVQSNTALDLGPYLEVVEEVNGPSGQRIVLSGVNLQVINGTDQATINGLGNVIIGYDSARSSGSSICSDGQYETENDCLGAAEVWAISHKSGSHNLVVGDENSYSQAGSIIGGNQNAVNRTYAAVLSGFNNVASGIGASVSGGRNSLSAGLYASINGGDSNEVTGNFSSILGGRSNSVSGQISVIVGSAFHAISGEGSVIVGGNSPLTIGTNFTIDP